MYPMQALIKPTFSLKTELDPYSFYIDVRRLVEDVRVRRVVEAATDCSCNLFGGFWVEGLQGFLLWSFAVLGL